MAVQFLFRSVPLLRLSVQHHRLAAVIFTPPCRPFSTEASESFQPAESLSSRAICSNEDPPKYSRGNDLDDVKWKVKEDEILRDIEPMTYLTREILHSKRYKNGERLAAEDEKAVVDWLLAYHPHSEDKIGCGLDSIVVDRHPEFRKSRCMFIVRTDGGVEDFSYRRCLQAYIRHKYPSHAERFIEEHFQWCRR